MIEIANIPPNIRRYIGGFVARRRFTALLRRIGMALAFAILWLLAWTLFDRLLPLPRFMRLVLLACNAIAIVWLLARPIAAILSRRFDWRFAAAQIEQRDPRFSGKLETAISQLVLAPSLRGSGPMLEKIVADAESLAGQKLSVPLVPMEPALRPWLMALAAALIMTMLAFSPWLDIPQLLRRALLPMAPAAPVTTTRILVQTADADVPQGESRTIVARADRLPDGQLTIHLSSDNGVSESEQAMLPDAQGQFTFVMNSVDRDWRYRITGGDARSPIYTIRVLRRPAIAQFKIRYIYPPYTGLEPANVVNTDGAMQALAGTQAVVDLVSTEPLQSAEIVMDGQHFIARATKTAEDYQANIPIAKSGQYQLNLRSERGVANIADEAKHSIQAIADEPPAARWGFQAQNLFVAADQTTILPYRVSDDYGAGSMSVQIDSPILPARSIALADSGEFLKDQQDHATLNLAELHPKVGDLLTVRLVAKDAAEQKGVSEPVNLIIAPQAIEADDHLRIAALRRAAAKGRELQTVSSDALRSEDENQHSGNPDPALRNSRMTRASVLCGDIAAALTQAVSHTASDPLRTALVALIDRTTVLQIHSRPFVPNDDPSAAQVQHDALSQNIEQARLLREQIEALRAGETAAMASRAMQNFQTLLPLAADEQSAQASLLREALSQAGQDVDEALTAIGVDPDDEDLDQLLGGKITQRDAVLKQLSADGDPSAKLLGQVTQAGMPREESSARLAAMARAEAVGSHANFATAATLADAAAKVNDLAEMKMEAMVLRESAQLAAGDLNAAEATDAQVHQIATSQPSPPAIGSQMLIAQTDRAAQRLQARCKAIAAMKHQRDTFASTQPSTQPASQPATTAQEREHFSASLTALGLAADQLDAALQSCQLDAARLRAESCAPIAATSSAGEVNSFQQQSTQAPSLSSPPPAIEGFDEPLHIYFQAIRRNP